MYTVHMPKLFQDVVPDGNTGRWMPYRIKGSAFQVFVANTGHLTLQVAAVTPIYTTPAGGLFITPAPRGITPQGTLEVARGPYQLPHDRLGLFMACHEHEGVMTTLSIHAPAPPHLVVTHPHTVTDHAVKRFAQRAGLSYAHAEEILTEDISRAVLAQHRQGQIHLKPPSVAIWSLETDYGIADLLCSQEGHVITVIMQ